MTLPRQTYKYIEKDSYAIHRITNIIQEESGADRSQIEQLVMEDRFAEYRSLCARFTTLLDYFNINYNKEKVRKKIGVFSIWLKLMDDLMESEDIGERILIQLRDKEVHLDEKKLEEPDSFFTELFKQQIEPQSYDTIISDLDVLYQSAVKEDNSQTIDEYISNCRVVGSLTGEVLYKIVQPDLSGNSEEFRTFFRDLGTLVELADSCWDIRKDRSNLKFNIGLQETLKLYTVTAIEGLKMFKKYPKMSIEFIRSVKRNLRHILLK
jgi:hypothetical protein